MCVCVLVLSFVCWLVESCFMFCVLVSQLVSELVS